MTLGSPPDYPLALDWLTLTDCPPLELVEIAAENRACSVALLVEVQGPLPDYGLSGSADLRRDVKRRCADLGLSIDVCESFRLRPDTVIGNWRRSIDAVVDLGALSVNVVAQDDDRARMIDNFMGVHEMLAGTGLAMLTEFTPRMSLKTLGEAVGFLDELKLDDVRIVADSLHVFRSGTPLSDLRRYGSRIGRAQICDGPATPPDDGGYEAMQERVYPGEGGLPLVEFVRALTPGIVIGVETPSTALREQGVAPRERARRAFAGARRVLQEAASAG